MPTTSDQSFDLAFERIKTLAADFAKNERRYHLSDYSESQARIDFIDKFWIALGWDVNHDTQTNPYEQDVKVERGGKGSERRRRADYAFLKPNFRDVRFYVEAKKPSGGIESKDHFFQTIRYGWNSSTPLAVLTDFEQFHILDCRYKPDIDTALSRGHKKFHYSEYGDGQKFAEIYHLFSREAVSGGSIERYAEGLSKPLGKVRQHSLFTTGGYQSVDESFLKNLDEYREELARSFKNCNPQLGSEELTEVTQRTLDRLVFIRFLEDKLIEPDLIIEGFGKSGSVWQDFTATSAQLDRVYNSIIFKRHEILDSPGFHVDERIFDGICNDLSRSDSPYDFNAIPIHILGSMYERFLGKTIIATDKRARVEEKPEVRKAGGVYYTPEYIVRYIVANTVGKLIEGKALDDIRQMRFADIACGSGSFLLGVYDLLLRYFTAYYNKNKKTRAEGVKAKCRQHDDGTLHLSLLQRREILLNNIYGVDIDAQAVEVAQLSLYLKMLEDETTASAKHYQFELREGLLPSLNKNIICGNSLICWDILDSQLFETGEERKLNPMNFNDAFPQIMKAGGFDAIVGNPPYLYSAGKNMAGYFAQKYKLSQYQTDFYVYFIEQALNLCKSRGKISYIVSDSWLNSDYFSKMREHLLAKHQIELLAVFDYPVFNKVALENSVFVATKSGAPQSFPVVKFSSPQKHATINIIDPGSAVEIGIIKPHSSNQTERILKLIEAGSYSLENVVRINRGVHAYRTDGYGVSKFGGGVQTKRDKEERSYHAKSPVDSTYLPEVKGKDVDRFIIKASGDYLSYGIWLAEPREPAYFFKPNIVLRKILGKKLHGAFISEPHAIDQSLYIIINDDSGVDVDLLKFILGVLLSSLGAWYLRTKYSIFDTLYPWYTKKQLASFPMKNLDRRMVQFVEQMISAKKQTAEARTDKDKAFYQNKCAALDRQIDRLVYELYGLTDEEIVVVEGTSQTG